MKEIKINIQEVPKSVIEKGAEVMGNSSACKTALEQAKKLKKPKFYTGDGVIFVIENAEEA